MRVDAWIEYLRSDCFVTRAEAEAIANVFESQQETIEELAVVLKSIVHFASRGLDPAVLLEEKGPLMEAACAVLAKVMEK